MSIDLIKKDDNFVNTGDMQYYTELVCSSRSEISGGGVSTDYRVGSMLVCYEDWSIWMLGRVGNDKQWLEVPKDAFQ